jgi:hypothetical protein
MMKRFYRKYKWYLPAMIVVLFFACKPAAEKYSGPKGYDFNAPEKFNMPESLLEISGIAFYKGNGNVVYSVQDEEGKLFIQNWGIKKQNNVKFSSKGDYEDLAILNDTFFIIKSSGTLLSFPYAEVNKKETEEVKQWKDILPDGEYESLYADEQNQVLYALCKNCEADKKTKMTTGYKLKYNEVSGTLTKLATFKIDASKAEATGIKMKSGLKPSALTKNPQTGEWYVLSSLQKVLVVAGADWEIKAVHKLSPSKFIQPEGIAFDKNFNLYISNEGDEFNAGNILKFKYKPAK